MPLWGLKEHESATDVQDRVMNPTKSFAVGSAASPTPQVNEQLAGKGDDVPFVGARMGLGIQQKGFPVPRTDRGPGPPGLIAVAPLLAAAVARAFVPAAPGAPAQPRVSKAFGTARHVAAQPGRQVSVLTHDTFRGM